jgi:hypothetical protein
LGWPNITIRVVPIILVVVVVPSHTTTIVSVSVGTHFNCFLFIIDQLIHMIIKNQLESGIQLMPPFD